MSEHTKGPWTIDNTGPHEFEEGHTELNIWGPDGAYFGAVAAIRDDYSGDMNANARLIAAAPELLEACKGVLGAIKFSGWDIDDPEWRGPIAIAREAIAKAESK